MKRLLSGLLALLLCLGLLCACGQDDTASFSQGDPHEGAEATIMVYLVGSNLESEFGAATADLLEMLNSGMDFEHKNLLVLTGGAKSWKSGTGVSADELGIYLLNKRGLNRVSRSAAASMGKPETLSSFLEFCYTNYPAESYGLILWDHGSGPMAGYGLDELYQDNLSVSELVKALEDSPFGPDNPLEFLGFDACLMSSAELAWSLRDYAGYMIASEESIPGGGWDYSFLADLAEGPMDGAAVGQIVVDSYAAYYSRTMEGEAALERLTMACLDLGQAELVEHALNELFSLLSADLASGSYAHIARLRQNVLPFAKYTTHSDYDLIDLGDLAEQLLSEYPEEANALLWAVDSMVVCEWSPLERAHGLSIYYPFDNPSSYSSAWGAIYRSFGFAPAYTTFMTRFARELTGGLSAAWSGIGLPPLVQDEASSEYYIQLTEEQAADYLDGSYYLLRKLDEGRYLLCGQRRDLALDGQNRLQALFGGYSVYVFNSVGESFPTLYYDYAETGSHDFHVAATLHTDPTGDGSFRMKNVWFLVSLPQPGASDALGVAIERRGDLDRVAYGKEQVWISDYPFIYFPLFETRERRDGEGRLLPVSQWDTQVSDSFAAYDSSRGWRAELRALGDDGYEYYLQIVARDIYGREYGSELIPVKLSRQGQELQGEMFQNRYYPLPARNDPIPALPPLESLRYFTDPQWYSPAEVEPQLVLDDPSGVRMSLLAGAYRLDAQADLTDLVLVFRVDNNSRYFDLFNLATDSNFRIQAGDRKVTVYFLPEIVGLWQQQGGSYYYSMSIPLSELPEDAASLRCVFRLSQKEWTSQLNLYYETDPVEIPLPLREEEPPEDTAPENG